MYERVQKCTKVNITSRGVAKSDPPCPCNGGVVVDVEERNLHFGYSSVCFGNRRHSSWTCPNEKRMAKMMNE